MPSYTSIWECSMGIPLEQLLQAIPLEQLLIQTVNGIVTGMILALVASGLTLIFGIMDVVNFAHGELYMLGAYVGTTTLAVTGSFWLALVGAAVAAAILAALWLFLAHATWGVWIRAVTQDRVMAAAMGIPVPRVHTVV